MSAETNPEIQAPSLTVLLLYIYSLWGFVVAQPIYSGLFKDGGFFRWYQNTVWDIWIALLVLSFLLPGLMVLLLGVLSRVFPVFTRRLCYVLISLLLGGFCLLFLGKYPNLSFLVKGLFGLICGIWLAQRLLRSKEREFLLYFLVAGALIFPLWFWVACPLTSPFQSQYQFNFLAKRMEASPRHPIVMIIFDELPLTSLLAKDGQIDAVHYPHFAALARNATWYPNAVTVNAITRGAVPAILTGRYPSVDLKWSSLLFGRYQYTCRDPLPTAREFPYTLFTLLENYYKMQVYESRIYLCNSSDCQKNELVQSDAVRRGRMFSNIAEEYFFEILFNSNDLYRDEFKLALAGQQGHKVSAQTESPISHDYDIDLFRQLLQAIHPPGKYETQPPFYFIHPILPHSPWEYYPSGKHYSALRMSHSVEDILCEESPSLLICNNSSSSKSLYQRHLLQVGYVDTLLGQVILKLQAAHLYERSLIVVTADHGISFMAQEPRRRVSTKNYADILSIPLFIKMPGEVVGKKDERQAETIDIVPTIAGLSHLPLTWHTDGRDLSKPWNTDRASHSICSPETEMNFKVEQIEAAKKKALHEKLKILHS